MSRLSFAASALLLLAVSCSRPAPDKGGNTITVSILPEKYFVEKIAGDLSEVNVMIPPGASPVTWEPSPAAMTRLGSSQMYFRIGKIVFEEVWMKKIAGLNPGLKIHDLSQGIAFMTDANGHDHGTGHYGNADPHIWMSPSNVRIIAGNTFRLLSAGYPADTAVFRKNYLTFLSEISAIDSAYQSHASVLNGMSFLIYHPALTYLARDYGMNQVVIEYEGKEPPPAHIRDIINLAEKKHITKIFVQKQFNMDNAKSLASEINGKIIPFDPLAENWEMEMYHILNTIVND